jgi:GAF domain-containing protein
MPSSDQPPPELPVEPAPLPVPPFPNEVPHSVMTSHTETSPHPGPSLMMGVYDEILRSLARGDGTHKAFSHIAEKVQLLTKAGSTAIALLNPDNETITFTAVAGREVQDLIGSRILISDTILGKTARTGEPYLTYRPTRTSTSHKTSTKPPEISSAAVMAIFREGRSVGAIALMNKEGGLPFNSDDLMALSTMAAAASVVLRNTQLQTESLRQGRELSTLYEAVRNVSGQLSVQEVLRTVVEQAGAHLENSVIVVFLINDERTHLYIAEDIGFDDFPDQREIVLSAEIGLGAAALRKTLPLEIAWTNPDEEDDPYWMKENMALPPETMLFESPFSVINARSGLSASIRSGDAAHGFVLVLSGEPPGLYTKADANLLSALAAQAAVAMENAGLYEDATRRASEAATLYDLSQAVTSTLQLPQVLDRIAESVRTLLAVDKFALFLFDPLRQRLQMVVERGLPSGAAERVQPALGQGIPGWVMEFETPTAVQDVAADHRNASAPLHPEGVVSMTCMPLQTGISTIGVLCALSSRRRLFTVAEMELLYTIANQAAIAIGNARIYADVQQKSRELRKYFHRVSRALGSSRFPGAVPELIVSLTQEITNSDYCALYSVTPAKTNSVAPSHTISLQLVSEAQVGIKTVGNHTPSLGETPTQWVGRRGCALAIRNIEEDARFRETALRPQRGKIVSYLGVPLRGVGGRQDVVGVLEIYTRSRREWRTEEIRLLITFASQAAAALRSAHEAEQREKSSRCADVALKLLKITKEATDPFFAERVLQCVVTLFDNPSGMAVFQRTAASLMRWQVVAALEVTMDKRKQIQEALEKGMVMTGVTSEDKNTYLYVGIAEDSFVSGLDLPVLQAAAELLSTRPEKADNSRK